MLYASRWVLAPIYLGLGAALFLLGVKFFQNDKLMWFVIIHLTFVLSALGMAYVDKMNKH